MSTSAPTTDAALQPSGVSLIAGVPARGDGPPFAAPGGDQGEYHAVSDSQLDAAVTAAAQARNAPLDRGAMAVALSAAADAFEAAADVVVATADAESHLGDTRLRGELARTVGQLRMMATEAREGRRRDVVIDPAGDGPAAPALHRTTIPLGVVAVFAASNFPLAFGVAGTDTAAAWGAGCPVVAKAHPAQPATAELCGRVMAEAVSAAGLHPGFYSLVHEGGHEVGQSLVRHPDVDAVAFTGSHRGGRALMDIAAARPRPIPVYAEMGSLNPLFVSPGAAEQRTQDLVEGILGSYLLGEGQFCTKPGLVVLPEGPAGRSVLDGLVEGLREHSPAHPMLYPDIASAFDEGVTAAVDLLGVTALHAPDPDPGAGCRATLLQATVQAIVEHPALRREVFGPVTVVVQATDAQMRDIVDLIEPALTGTVHFQPEESAWARSMADHLARKVGRVVANGYPTGVRVSSAQHHGGPYPATSSPLHTSVGLAAIDRFLRPVVLQSFDEASLPEWAATG